MKRIPRGDETICPHCGKPLGHGDRVYDPTDEEVRKIREANLQNERKRSISRLGTIAIFGLVFLFVGLGFAIIGFQSDPSLVGGMLSALVGGFILLDTFISVSNASRRRIKRGEPETVFDAMSLGIGLPSWWQWWHAFIPFVVILILAGGKIITSTEFWIIFLGYSGVAVLYQYLAARRLVSMQNKAYRTLLLQSRIPVYHRNYSAVRQAIKLSIFGGIAWAAERLVQTFVLPAPSEIRLPPTPLALEITDQFLSGFILAFILSGIYIGTIHRLPTRSHFSKSLILSLAFLVVITGSFTLLNSGVASSYFSLSIAYNLPSYLLLGFVIAFANKTKV